MKIELKLSSDAIMALNKMLGYAYDAKNIESSDSKAIISIAIDLADKFDSKTRNLIKKQSLFDNKKRHKVSLKFHEAWAMEIIIRSTIDIVNDDYSRNLLRNVADMLNQKIM